VIDGIFLYMTWDLATSSTKEEANNYKLKSAKIQGVQFYLEIFRWFLLIPKVDLTLGAIFCGIFDSSDSSAIDRCKELPSFASYPEISLVLSIIQLSSLLLTSTLFIIVFNTAGFMA